MDPTAVFDFIQKYDGLLGIASMIFIAWLGSKFVAKDYFGAYEKAQADLLKALGAKLDAVEDRVTIVEKDMEHLPDKGSFHRMEISLVELKGQLQAMDERLKPVASMANRLHEHMLDTNK